ncbi:hypothetical protein ACTQ49_07100 [Luteococcus sp. Sow4_B9]|uniref:hypothetical protein n=1 Tax=Luteococcus sp. Sow4_B9 TaxID=3438792 RepID=UPI003F95EC49
MDLRDFTSTLARWWYLSLATLLLAIGAGFGLYKSTGPSYTAESTVLLLPPKAVLLDAQRDKTNYAPDNPLLYLSSLTDARDVLIRNLDGADAAKELDTKAPGADLTVKGDITSGSPLILVTSDAATEEAALKGTKAVNEMVPAILAKMQDDIDIKPLQRINSITVTSDSEATPDNKNQIVMAIAGFGGTLALGLAAIALLDQARTRRQRKDESAAVTTGARQGAVAADAGKTTLSETPDAKDAKA